MAAPTSVLFVPECHADTAVILTLLRENSANRKRLLNYVSHQQGIGNVGNNLRRQPVASGSARRVVGIVDLDKKSEHPYLREFTRVRGGGVERNHHSHALLQHQEHASQYLIALNPACDKWIWDRVVEVGMTPADFGLPNDFEGFKGYCKTQAAERNPQLRVLLAAVATAYHPAYRTLAEFVADIMDLSCPLP